MIEPSPEVSEQGGSPPAGRLGSFGFNAVLSLAPSVASAVVTVITLPFIVGRLGLAQYGLFTLLALTTNFLGVLDLGFGWTTSRYLADAIERRDQASGRNVLRISLAFYLCLGGAGCVAMLASAELLTNSVFQVPENLRGVAVESLRIFGVAFPFGMLLTFVVSVLRGASRFDIVSGIQLAVGPGTSLGMVLVLALDRGLLGVSAVILGSQALISAAGLVAARQALPGMLTIGPINLHEARSLVRFTLAVSVASLGMQLLYLPNRLAVGVLLSLRSVGLFTLPFSLAQRLLFVPSALGSVALPAMTAASAREDWDDFRRAFWRSMATTLLLLVPALSLIGLWAPIVLRVWFSTDFNESSAWVLRLALLAIFLNAIVAILVVACDSVGKPHISAAGVTLAGIFNVPMAFLLTWTHGIVGSAVALALSFAVDIGVIVALWQRERMPSLALPIPQGAPRLGVPLFAAVWTAAVLVVQPVLESRLILASMAIAALAIAYGYVVLAVLGPRRVAAWFSAAPAP